MRAYRIIAVGIAWATFYGAGPALAVPIQAIDNPWKICARETAKVERQKGIPEYLLAAISLTETGRWNEERRENIAWPWTVTARGEGRYFASKRGAITHVYELWDEGVENIDVGCMQINLRYHGRAFANLDEAFDPAANTEYAAQFLKELNKQTRSWTGAAAQYHSADPVKNRPYKRTVLKYWNRQRSKARQESRRQRLASRKYKKPVKTEKSGKSGKSGKKAPVITGRGLLATWRNNGSKAAADQALIQRVRAAAREREKLLARFTPTEKAPSGENPFTEKSRPVFTGKGRSFFRARRLSFLPTGG